MTQTAAPATETESLIRGIHLFAYFTGDPARSIAFYRDVLGMVPTEIDEQGRGAEFTLPTARRSAFGSPRSTPRAAR